MDAKYRGGEPLTTLLERCRDLRRGATDAEQVLWRLLRNRQVGGAKFRRQHQFGPYILDFYCAEANLAIEADGGQHYSDEGAKCDRERARYLDARSVRTLRFSNLEVLQNTEGVVRRIWEGLGLPSP